MLLMASVSVATPVTVAVRPCGLPLYVKVAVPPVTSVVPLRSFTVGVAFRTLIVTSFDAPS